MKFIRFKHKNEPTIIQGIITDIGIKPIEGDMYADWKIAGELYNPEEIEILEPLTPRHVIGIGANYVGKWEDLPTDVPELPVFFYKPVSSVIGSGTSIVIPQGIDEVKFESELAAVIGKTASQITEIEAADYIFGYTVANDVTAPQFFHEDGHWMIGKSFDTFTPLGPCIETEIDPDSIRVEAYLNGDKKQESPTTHMIVPMRKMIAYLSSVMTLEPGDVILTGSPLGAEMMRAGDEIVCQIDGIGELPNPVEQKANVRLR
ncbi:2-keto-4-pentenoate hydratase/2-oxohepta-3-ene-1,7-dioic acid hydratase (catechol pathway) [Lentibacillus halodurans]|uniref:2-keto-4-pentenoate hydratase/2-oxohepta-3-ene-1,7-dioic acid hydratase (Catechol pathway) n=1 Tax=Lentibacillus halodurans TaxID=237679 RepID=A0A1I0XI44_9BACI|nr:fumarylacetoacetate hydrolase family protein [Lentibacillus halodurans]SFA99623.1 2-keto-4-pentenoate hydratase/2-oxohepta-3-ene-1,7-dioic acid hydratase (catechol pathway) [Lentibacillus halodurans]